MRINVPYRVIFMELLCFSLFLLLSYWESGVSLSFICLIALWKHTKFVFLSANFILCFVFSFFFVLFFFSSTLFSDFDPRFWWELRENSNQISWHIWTWNFQWKANGIFVANVLLSLNVYKGGKSVSTQKCTWIGKSVYLVNTCVSVCGKEKEKEQSSLITRALSHFILILWHFMSLHSSYQIQLHNTFHFEWYLLFLLSMRCILIFFFRQFRFIKSIEILGSGFPRLISHIVSVSNRTISHHPILKSHYFNSI